jgi:hypothetical protein
MPFGAPSTSSFTRRRMLEARGKAAGVRRSA